MQRIISQILSRTPVIRVHTTCYMYINAYAWCLVEALVNKITEAINYPVTGRGKAAVTAQRSVFGLLIFDISYPSDLPYSCRLQHLTAIWLYCIDVYSITEIWPYQPYYLLTLSTIFMYEFMAINNNVCNVCHQELIFNPTGWFKFKNVIS